MTTISESHRLANTAVLAVCTILAQAGALTETIKNDYGEDLLVQTHLRNSADSFHVLVQVKGIAKRKPGSITLRVSDDHLMRWLYLPQPFLLCVFVQSEGKAYACSPSDRFSLWELATSRGNSRTIRFSDDDLFDTDSALRYIWRSRIEYYSRILAHSCNRAEYIRGIAPTLAPKAYREAHVITVAFLNSLGVILGDAFADEFRAMIGNASRNLSREADLYLRDVFELAMLGWVDNIASVGLPPNLLDYSAEIAGLFFKEYHSQDWERAQALFQGKHWNPMGVTPRRRQAQASLSKRNL